MIDPQNKTSWEADFDDLSFERVIKVTGTVQPRPAGQENKQMATGAIELHVTSLEVLSKSKTLPYALIDEPATSEETRMKYRYLDLRRRKVLKNIEFRAKMNHFTRNRFTEQGFLEVQTPLFTVSSPEGARDYLIPSRVNPGQFYALPQAPQQYKQLLMMGGIDKYFQIAPCFRDEDPRADRAMCEFYQVDLEMTFVDQADVLKVLSEYALNVAKTMVPNKIVESEIVHLTYQDAMDRYGCDKPDLRFGMEIVDLTSELTHTEFGVFKNAIANGGVVRAIKLEQQSMSRKELDELTEIAKRAGAGGLAYLIYETDEIKGPVAKFFSAEEMKVISDKLQAKSGDIIFFAADKRLRVCKVLDKIRLFLRGKYHLADDNKLAFCFVVDFPLYEYDEDKDSRDFGHNPFSHVVGGLDALDTDDLSTVKTNQYDMVLNGFELGSGSIRNYLPEVMVKVFEKVGLSEADVKNKFGAMYEAFQYGCPPHGGFAFGFDRFMMILLDEPNIRECYAFPKSWKAEDAMMGAPSMIDENQLKELHISVPSPDTSGSS